MNGFVLALAGFVALHIGVSATGLRARLVARMGAGPYRIAFSLASLGLLAWMIVSFGAMRGDPFDPLNQVLWSPPAWARGIGQLLVLIGFVFAVSGLVSPSPTLAGAEGLLRKEAPARGIVRITRHPFLWGVALWAAGHLLANGERFAPMLFGALAAMVLFGTRSIDRKSAARDPENWARFAAATSNVPFAAIVQGRNRLAFGEMALGLVAAFAAYALMLYFHGALIGKPAY